MLVNSNHFLSTLLLPPVPIRWVLSDLGIPLLSQVAHKSNVTFYKFPELLIIFSFASFNFTDKTVGRLQWDWNLDRQRRRRVGWPIDCQHRPKQRPPRPKLRSHRLPYGPRPIFLPLEHADHHGLTDLKHGLLDQNYGVLDHPHSRGLIISLP